MGTAAAATSFVLTVLAVTTAYGSGKSTGFPEFCFVSRTETDDSVNLNPECFVQID